MELEPTLTVDERGNRRWRLNGEFHRTDGPAIEWADGDRWWFLNGQNYNFQQWLDEMNFDEHTRLLMTLKYSR